MGEGSKNAHLFFFLTNSHWDNITDNCHENKSNEEKNKILLLIFSSKLINWIWLFSTSHTKRKYTKEKSCWYPELLNESPPVKKKFFIFIRGNAFIRNLKKEIVFNFFFHLLAKKVLVFIRGLIGIQPMENGYFQNF